MQSPSRESPRLRFGAFEVDPPSGKLLKSGTPLKLPPQPFKLLLLLLEDPGEVVSRERIRQRLWGDSTFVDFERGINFSINQIRVALCDDSDKPRYIETLPKIGYRFIATVSRNGSALPNSMSAPANIIGRPTRAGSGTTTDHPLQDNTTRVGTQETGATVDAAILSENGSPANLIVATDTEIQSARAAAVAPILRKRKLWLGVGTALVILGIIAWGVYDYLLPKFAHFQRIEVTQVTSNGRVKTAAISPDGRYVGYVVDEGSANPSLGWVGEERNHSGYDERQAEMMFKWLSEQMSTIRK